MSRLGSIPALGLLSAVLAGVCSAQAPPPVSNPAATVVTLTGQVSVMRDAMPWALQVGASIKPGQLIFTGPDGYAEFQVSDGSTFEVFPNSRVIFRENPGDWKELLDMLLGRIKVHIQRWGGQPNENKVHTPTAIISVRGTVFDVSVEDGDATVVEVEEGQVEVEHRLIPGRAKLLNPGETLRIDKHLPIARSLDKSGAIQLALRALREAVYTAVYRSPRGTVPIGPGGVSGGGLPGDHGAKNPGSPTPPTNPTPPGDAGPGAPPPPPGH